MVTLLNQPHCTFFPARSNLLKILGGALLCTSTMTGAADSAQCVAKEPALQYGAGRHQPAAEPVPRAASAVSGQPARVCSQDADYFFGAGRADITGPAGGKIHMGNETQDNYSAGIHIRQYARSFVISSPCSGKRVALIVTDTGMFFESVRQAVLAEIATDPELAAHYGADNIMMSATHTHSTPGGQAHYTAYNAFRLGHDPQTFAITVDGVLRAFRTAHQHHAQQARAGVIRINQGELLGANGSRAFVAYASNPEEERSRYRDVADQDIETNRLMTLLRFQRKNRDVASMNWFAVHPTSDTLSEYGVGAVPISGDNKGYAAYRFEAIRNADGRDEAFVAGFMQADEGDAYTDFWPKEHEIGEQRARELLPNEPSPVAVAVGTAQLDSAMRLHDTATESLHGPIDYRFGYVKMDEVEVNDPIILASLQHPAELDTPEKRTCTAAMGISFPAGGYVGVEPGEPGAFTPAGVTCKDPDYAQAVIDDFMFGMRAGEAGTFNAPPYFFSTAVGCNLQKVPGLNLSCQAEKPVLFVFGPPVNVSANVLPFQLFRIGNLAIIGLPWEVTTMAGRRIRETLLDVLREDGVDFAVINGLSNDYVSYLTTREEYAVQQYEGASNQFGPWSLAVVQQEVRRLALDLRAGRPTSPGPEAPSSVAQPQQVLPPQGFDQVPPGSRFGALVSDVSRTYQQGEVARAVFQASSPNRDVKTDDSFLFVEKLQGRKNWRVVAVDADPETSFVWHSESPQPQFMPNPVSTAEILWRIPADTPRGSYRIRFTGTANTGGVQQTAYEGVSSTFEVAGRPAKCP